MDRRRYELATVAAAKRLGSSYCSLAHGKVLAERFYDADRVRAIFTDRASAGIDEVDIAVMDLAEKVAADATSVSEGDIQRLLELGLSERDVLDVVLTAAARTFFAKLLDAMGVAPDGSYRQLDGGLAEALTVGRPIEGRCSPLTSFRGLQPLPATAAQRCRRGDRRPGGSGHGGGGGLGAPRRVSGRSWPDAEVVSPVQPHAARKSYVCPGCESLIAPGTYHVVVVPEDAPDLRRHWHRGCWYKEQRRRHGATATPG